MDVFTTPHVPDPNLSKTKQAGPKITTKHLDGVKSGTVKIKKFIDAFGGFDGKAVQAHDIYFLFVCPVVRAFGEEEDIEPTEEEVVGRCSNSVPR